MELLILCALIGCIPAAIASSKGRSFFGWWLYGALFFIIAQRVSNSGGLMSAKSPLSNLPQSLSVRL